MDGGVLQCLGDLCEIQITLPDHQFALLQLDSADVFAGGELQMLVKQGGQIAWADIGVLRHQRHTQAISYIGADILLCPADDLVFIGYAVGAFQCLHGGITLPLQIHQYQRQAA